MHFIASGILDAESSKVPSRVVVDGLVVAILCCYTLLKYKEKLFKIMLKIEYIFIDEVSMMVKDFYQLFTLVIPLGKDLSTS